MEPTKSLAVTGAQAVKSPGVITSGVRRYTRPKQVSETTSWLDLLCRLPQHILKFLISCVLRLGLIFGARARSTEIQSTSPVEDSSPMTEKVAKKSDSKSAEKKKQKKKAKKSIPVTEVAKANVAPALKTVKCSRVTKESPAVQQDYENDEREWCQVDTSAEKRAKKAHRQFERELVLWQEASDAAEKAERARKVREQKAFAAKQLAVAAKKEADDVQEQAILAAREADAVKIAAAALLAQQQQDQVKATESDLEDSGAEYETDEASERATSPPPISESDTEEGDQEESDEEYLSEHGSTLQEVLSDPGLDKTAVTEIETIIETSDILSESENSKEDNMDAGTEAEKKPDAPADEDTPDSDDENSSSACEVLDYVDQSKKNQGWNHVAANSKHKKTVSSPPVLQTAAVEPGFGLGRFAILVDEQGNESDQADEMKDADVIKEQPSPSRRGLWIPPKGVSDWTEDSENEE